MMNKINKLILASQSPRRRELIRLLGLPFESMVADVDESSVTNGVPSLNVVETAQLKSNTIANRFFRQSKDNGTWIIAADTTVALDGVMLNKPIDANDAYGMLVALRNRSHKVHTGMVLHCPATGAEVTAVTSATVFMRNYSDAEIAAYVASGDPLDKAGAYAIQHPGFQPVAKLSGCFLGVMGLSICHLIQLMAQVGLERRGELTAVLSAHQQYQVCPIFPQISPLF